MFDLLDPSEAITGEPFEAAYGDHSLVRFFSEETGGGHIELHIDMFENGTLKFAEVIREKVHAVDAICGLLRENGFTLLQCADRLLLDSDSHGTTWFIAAQRTQST